MDKEKTTPLKPGLPEDEERVKKILLAEGELEIPIGEKEKKKVYWVRQGFNWRTYYEAYARKKIKEAVKLGVISVDHYSGVPKGIVDGKNMVFILDPYSVVDETLKVKIGSTLKKEDVDYVYDSTWRVLSFLEKAPANDIVVEYDYYDPKIYDEIVRDAQNCMMICLAVREKDNHEKKIFEKIEDVEKLSTADIYTILGEYAKQIALTENDLKKLQASSPSEGNTG